MALNLMNKDPNYASYKIGKYTYGNPKIESWKFNTGKLEIGSFCSISRGVTIFLGGDHHTEWVTTSSLAHLLNCESGNPSYLQIRTDGDVKIGNDVWIGTEAMILSGVTIGDGAVIGARAVVSKSIPPYTVAVGNSAIVVKERFNNDCVKKLLKIQWWNWDDDKIKRNIKLLLNSNIDAFIKEHEVK